MRRVLILAAVSMLLLPLTLPAEKNIQFAASAPGMQLHMGDRRAQILIFVPEVPGAESGKWRIAWNGGEKIAELLLRKPIPIPEFKERLVIEMDILCEPGTFLLSADLRLADAQGEICALNRRVDNKYTGKITAVWEIVKGQEFKMAWGNHVNHRLDLPASITNFAFLVKESKGEITLEELRITADPAVPNK